MSDYTMKAPRRIVTGHDKNGKAIVAIDDRPSISPRIDANTGSESNLRAAIFWNSREFPSNNSLELSSSTLSQNIGHSVKGGSVFRISDFGPGLSSPLHRTVSLDYAILLAGKNVEIELDDGKCEKVEVGDVIIQRGTIHAWHNRGEDWARFAFILLDAEPVKTALGEELPQILP